jgi:GNAT superfamily N-acetyltransferase
VELSLRVERATSADLAQLAALRIEQGWHSGEALLGAIQAWENGRHFILRASAVGENSAPDPTTIIAATSAIVAGTVAVIGNVITRPGARGRGLGRTLMTATLDWLRDHGARSVLLDATSEGQPLYHKLGFVPRERSWYASTPLAALDATAAQARAGSAHARLRPLHDLSAIAALDRAAFGGDRLELLRLVASAADCWLYTTGPDASPDGYLLVRALESPQAGVRLGPWVAKTPQASAALLEATLREDAPWREALVASDKLRVTFSTSAASMEALSLFRASGGTPAEDDVVMRFDFADEPARPVAEHSEWLYSWLAPMVF